MGTGKTITCRQCGIADLEHASKGLCFRCYRAEQRLLAVDPEALSEALASKTTKALSRSRAQMRDVVFALVMALEVIREHGHASGLLADQSTVCDDLARMLGPLMAKLKETIQPATATPAPAPTTIAGRTRSPKIAVGLNSSDVVAKSEPFRRSKYARQAGEMTLMQWAATKGQTGTEDTP
jgi:hypothetical protein